MKRSFLAAKKLNVQMNSLPSVAVLLHIEMMKWAIVITTPTVLCVVTLTAKQKHQLVAGFMLLTEQKLNAQQTGINGRRETIRLTTGSEADKATNYKTNTKQKTSLPGFGHTVNCGL